MANQLASLPWVIDTPSDDPLFTGEIKIQQIVYVEFTDPSHVAEIQDTDGNLVASLSGNTNPQSGHAVGWVKGLLVPLVTITANPNLQSGRILIYLE